MSHTRIVDFFSAAVNQVAENIEQYAHRPGVDFTRNNKLPITKLLPFLVSQGSSSTKNELTEAFNFAADRPSASAFTQQRAKLKPEGMEALFHQFTASLDELHPVGKYRFLAADGSTFTFLSNEQLSPPEYYTTQGNSADGCHSVHAIAMYDLDADIYTDCIIQPIRNKDEFGAFRDIVDRHPLPADGTSLVFLADRGFCSYNNMAHVIERGQYFLFRAKDITSKGLLHHIDLPDSDTFDLTIKFILVRRQSTKLQIPVDGYRRFVGEAQSFDYVDYGSSDYYELTVRVIRFELSPGNFESLVTNLPLDEFPVDALKVLYHRRWDIETSFRSLKYAIGLTKFHASKADFVLQEIWARLTAYNFTEAITHCVCITEKPKNKHGCKINFSAAVHVCRQFLRSALTGNVAVLKMGNIPQQMEDKWFWYCEGNTLYAHRSWTGFCIYILQMNPGKKEHLATVNRFTEQYSCTDIAEDEKNLNMLLDWWTQPKYDYYHEWLEETLIAIQKQKQFDSLTIEGRTVPAIYFHLPEEPYGFLSNWYMSDFVLDGIEFNSNEQYIMYRKAKLLGDDETAEAILAADTPAEHQRLGQKAKGYNDALWYGMRQIVAARGLYAKFSQNEELKKQLLETDDAFLVECAYKDLNWACGWHLDDDERKDISKWRGKNLLGFALMEVREQLRDLK